MDPQPTKEFLKKLHDYDPKLMVRWDRDKKLWAVGRMDVENNSHHIMFVQNKDGTFRQLDERVLRELYECDIWRLFEKPGDYHKFIQDKNATVALKEKELQKDYLRWWNREHKTEWKQAIDNAQRGVLDIPDEPKPRVFIDLNRSQEIKNEPIQSNS